MLRTIWHGPSLKNESELVDCRADFIFRLDQRRAGKLIGNLHSNQQKAALLTLCAFTHRGLRRYYLSYRGHPTIAGEP